MKEQIPCKTELIEDSEYRCIVIYVPKNYAEHFLLLINALEFDRVSMIEFYGNSFSAKISNAGNEMYYIHFSSPDFVMNLSAVQITLLKCCCIDCALNNYESPHVDLECDICDLTITFY